MGVQERKNDLESYIYSMRDRVSCGDLAEYMSQADKDVFLPKLDEMENWLYDDEAETANKSTFIAKLEELQKYGTPCLERLKEEDERPEAYKELEKVLAEYSEFASTTDPAYEHIDEEARGKVRACVTEVSEWLSSIKAEQAGKAKTDVLTFRCKDIYSKRDHVQFTCRPIKTKPKPKPPPPPVKEEAAAPPAGDQAPAEGAASAATDQAGDVPVTDIPPAAGDAPPAADSMDVGLH